MTDELVRLANAVLWPGFLGTEAPDWLLAELRDGLAGAVYFSQNVGDGLPALSDEILRANPDALIGIDEEGGNVTRLESATGSPPSRGPPSSASSTMSMRRGTPVRSSPDGSPRSASTWCSGPSPM
ncbi:beta-glucosidase-like glycosyl hydrolase [Microbacterium foliorum]|uniref:Beta-glucosidase-like glycosyl hydrolase n=1 Tax=Microbacterium foliorum TaxID=104336 RepID=A0ABU1HKM5_9MICO|nr:hypothetical protein [Microbacterium foliorum]MDR6140582.1 beta-glucosidase-like glycosyl hydrolase [Microbacterium foliorum]